MRKLTLLLALVTVFSFARQANAQGVTVSGTALANAGYYARIVPSAVITVCPANSAGTPCTPTSVSLFSNFALTTPVTNPFNADANGNYSFYLAPGNYTVTITGVGVAGYSYQISLIGPSVGTPNTWTQLQIFNLGIILGSLSTTQSLAPASAGVYNLGSTLLPYAAIAIGSASGQATTLTATATSSKGVILPDVSGTSAIVTSTNTTALSTGALGGAGCEATITVGAASATTSSQISWNFTSDPSAVAGYGGAPIDAIHILAWTTAGNVNFKQCSSTAVTPGAISIRWSVSN